MAAVDFEIYRSMYGAFDLHPGPEATGIIDPDTFDAVTKSPDTLMVDVAEQSIPLMVPAREIDYVNTDYYKRLLGGEKGSNVPTYLLTIPLSLARRPEIVREIIGVALEQPDGLVLAFDYPTSYSGYTQNIGDRHATSLPSTDERSLLAQFDGNGISATDITRPQDVHYHFVDQLTHESGNISEIPVVVAVNAEAKTVKHDGKTGLSVSIDPILSDDDIEQIWNFYDSAHQGISDVDPVMPGFSKTELTEVLGSTDYIKSVCRVGNTILNILILMDARLCPWADKRYFMNNDDLRTKYINGQVLFGAGVVSNFKASIELGLTSAASVETIGAAGRRFVDLGIEPAIVVTCNKLSHFKVKPASLSGLRQNGVDATFPLASVQRFGAVLLNK